MPNTLEQEVKRCAGIHQKVLDLTASKYLGQKGTSIKRIAADYPGIYKQMVLHGSVVEDVIKINLELWEHIQDRTPNRNRRL